MHDVVTGLVGVVVDGLVDTVTYGLLCLAISVVVLPPLLLWQHFRRRRI